jgi:hypothetical protein
MQRVALSLQNDRTLGEENHTGADIDSSDEA